MKRKQHVRPQINDDLRWQEHKDLVKKGDKLKANKLRDEILDSYRYKKPCHHVSEGK